MGLATSTWPEGCFSLSASQRLSERSGSPWTQKARLIGPPRSTQRQQLVAAGVGRVAVDLHDFGGDGGLHAEDLHRVASLADAPAESVLGLEADEEDGVGGIADVVGQVVEDAACLGHPGGGDDDRRPLQGVEALRLVEVADIVNQVVVEDRDPGLDELLVLVENLGMQPEDVGGLDGEG